MSHAGWMMIAVVGHVVGLVGAMGYGISTLAGGLREASPVTRVVWCPIEETDEEVVFLAQDGIPYDIKGCSVFPAGEVPCRKACLVEWAGARAA